MPLMSRQRSPWSWSRLFRLLVLLLIVAGVMSADAPGPDSWKPQGYVSDFANVLTADQRAQLNQQAGAIEQRLGVQIAMVTVPTIGDAAVSDYAYEMAHHWGVGHKGKDDGILILIAVQDHKYSVQVGYGLEPYMTDADAGSWMRRELPDMRAGNFNVVFGAMLSQIDETLSSRMGKEGASPSPVPRRSSAQGARLPQTLGTILFFFILFLVMAGIFSRGRGCGTAGCLWPFLFGGWGGAAEGTGAAVLVVTTVVVDSEVSEVATSAAAEPVEAGRLPLEAHRERCGRPHLLPRSHKRSLWGLRSMGCYGRGFDCRQWALVLPWTPLSWQERTMQ